MNLLWELEGMLMPCLLWVLRSSMTASSSIYLYYITLLTLITLWSIINTLIVYQSSSINPHLSILIYQSSSYINHLLSRLVQIDPCEVASTMSCPALVSLLPWRFRLRVLGAVACCGGVGFLHRSICINAFGCWFPFPLRLARSQSDY